ncbi:Zinc transporter ZIP11 [Nymphon striatum]|nr:Zinc transporter ZIP11 [Nymphon striatum]
MIRGASPVIQALLGTLFTWGVTAAGSALVFIFSKAQRKILDGSLGFAAGVMTAASFWSLLAPAIEMAQSSGTYGASGEYAFLPVAFGFFLGSLFVYGTDVVLPFFGISSSPNVAFALQTSPKVNKDKLDSSEFKLSTRNSILDSASYKFLGDGPIPYKRPASCSQYVETSMPIEITENKEIIEGLAVGVGFAAVNKTETATFENARNLAIGIGIQNFPEGLAVSLPLKGAGFSTWRSFWYGQLSGMVEPIAGVLGAMAVTIAEPLLPYAMSFAAGAMIYVVFNDILPEAQICMHIMFLPDVCSGDSSYLQFTYYLIIIIAGTNPSTSQ